VNDSKLYRDLSYGYAVKKKSSGVGGKLILGALVGGLLLNRLLTNDFEDIGAAIKRVSDKYNIDREYLYKLKRLESSGNPEAVSPTGARGLWQFIKSTGKSYGLTTDSDRHDITKSTEAVARFTKDNIDSLRRNGIPVTNENLYMSHMLGSSGFKELYECIFNRCDPSSELKTIMKYNGGKNMSPSEFYRFHVNRYRSN
jgi:hypothetical protein